MNKLKMSGLSPEHFARDLLHRLDISKIPTPTTEICKLLGIELFYSDELDAEAYFIRTHSTSVIVVKDSNCTYSSRQSFSIAHELGHFTIPGHRDEYKCTLEDLNSYTANMRYEKEANDFASELLMPSKYFDVDVRKTILSMNTLISLSEKYGTSLTATAIRYIKKTSDPGAIVCSKDGKILYAYKSPTFKYDLHWGHLSPNTYASEFFSKGSVLDGTAHQVRYDAWISTPIYDDNLVFAEETISMPLINQTLSIIRTEDYSMDDDDDNYNW